MQTDCDILVVGGGACGLAMALALEQAGFEVILVDANPRPPSPSCHPTPPCHPEHSEGSFKEGRSTALLPASIEFLGSLDVWPSMAGQIAPVQAKPVRAAPIQAAPVRAVEIIACGQDQRPLSRWRFTAAEAGLEALAHHIFLEDLLTALRDRVGHCRGLQHVYSRRLVDLIDESSRMRALFAGDGEMTARLIVAADGRESATRGAAGIKASPGRTKKAAIVAILESVSDPNGLCSEFHLKYGPLTLTPLPPAESLSDPCDALPVYRLALVWVTIIKQADTLLTMSEEEFLSCLRPIAGDLIGATARVRMKQLYPIWPQSVNRLVQHRLALVGEAAHVLPPTGAQGLNLSLADVRVLVACLEKARRLGAQDPGSMYALAEYARQRRRDIQARSLASQMLDRWASARHPLETGLRAATLQALVWGGRPLKRPFLKMGLGQS